MMSGLLFAVSAIAQPFRTRWRNLRGAADRGFAVGAASVLAPLYIAEVAQPRTAGMLVALNQMTIVSGILFRTW